MRAPWVCLFAFVVDRIWKSYVISLCSRASASSRQALSTSKERVMAGGLRAREERGWTRQKQWNKHKFPHQCSNLGPAKIIANNHLHWNGSWEHGWWLIFPMKTLDHLENSKTSHFPLFQKEGGCVMCLKINIQYGWNRAELGIYIG